MTWYGDYFKKKKEGKLRETQTGAPWTKCYDRDIYFLVLFAFPLYVWVCVDVGRGINGEWWMRTSWNGIGLLGPPHSKENLPLSNSIIEHFTFFALFFSFSSLFLEKSSQAPHLLWNIIYPSSYMPMYNVNPMYKVVHCTEI